MNETTTQTHAQADLLAQEPASHQSPAVRPTTAPAAALPATSAPVAMDVNVMWQSLVEMAKDPTIDAAKIESLIGLQERMYDRAAEKAYRIAKNQVMALMPIIDKGHILDHKGTFICKYAKWEDLRVIIDEISTPFGIRLSHREGFSEIMKMPTHEAVLSFAQGDYTYVEYCGAMAIPFDGGGSKSPAQGAGSGQTYGFKFTAYAALGIVTRGVDDEGKQSGSKSQQNFLGRDERDILEQCQREAQKGLASWTEFVKSKTLTGVQKGWLFDMGHHKELTTAATNFGE